MPQCQIPHRPATQSFATNSPAPWPAASPASAYRHEKFGNYVTWPAWENWNVFQFNWCLYISEISDCKSPWSHKCTTIFCFYNPDLPGVIICQSWICQQQTVDNWVQIWSKWVQGTFKTAENVNENKNGGSFRTIKSSLDSHQWQQSLHHADCLVFSVVAHLLIRWLGCDYFGPRSGHIKKSCLLFITKPLSQALLKSMIKFLKNTIATQLSLCCFALILLQGDMGWCFVSSPSPLTIDGECWCPVAHTISGNQ